MKTYDLFGVEAQDLETARRLIEGLLGIRLVAHESGYLGDPYYRLGGAGAEHFILQRNHDTFEDEWMEPAFPDKNFLFYVSESPRSEQIAAALLTERRIGLLRRQLL